MAIIQPSAGKAPVIDDDIYEVVCLSVIEKHLETADEFGKSDKLDFKIELVGEVDEDGEPVTLDPRCNRAWSERSTLFKWAQAFGLDPDPLQPIDTDRFVGLHVRADIRTESEGKWPKVVAFSPLPKSRQGKAPAAPTQPTAASNGPPMVTPAGDVDWQLWWREVERAGGTKEGVAKMLNVDFEKLSETLSDMTLTAVMDLLEVIKGAVTA